VDVWGAVESCTADDDTPDTDAEVPDGLTISGGTVNNSIIGGTVPQAGTFTTLTAGAAGFTVDAAGAITKVKSIAIGKVDGVAGSQIYYESNSTDINGVGWMGPNGNIASDLYFQFSTTLTPANSLMVFGTPAGGVSTLTWGTYLGATIDDTEMTAEDFGDFTCTGAENGCTIDSGAVTVAQGGTGRATGTTAYSLIATGTTATGAQQTLGNGGTTQILVGGGAAALPAWGTDIPTAVTIGSAYVYRAAGTDVPATDGGTGQSSYAVGDILYAPTTTTVGKLVDVAAGQPL
jgi:hypothetical protein